MTYILMCFVVTPHTHTASTYCWNQKNTFISTAYRTDNNLQFPAERDCFSSEKNRKICEQHIWHQKTWLGVRSLLRATLVFLSKARVWERECGRETFAIHFLVLDAFYHDILCSHCPRTDARLGPKLMHIRCDGAFFYTHPPHSAPWNFDGWLLDALK